MKLVDRLFEPVDASAVVFFRIAFGILMAIELGRYLALGWVDYYWIDPDFHFKYFGFEWVHAWPGVGMYVHFGVLFVCALMIAAGLLYRIAAAVFFVGFTYVFLLDQSQYLNHFYLICLFAAILVVIPAHRNGSVDARRRPRLRANTLPVWTVWVLRFQMGIVYFYGGIAKLNGDWLRGEPLTTWLQETPNLIGVFHEPIAGFLLSWGGLLFDLLIVPALLWKRTRVPAFAVLVVFHLMNAYLFNIGIFPWFSIVASLIFFPPDWKPFRKIVERFREEPIREPPPPPRRLVLVFLGLWVAVQVLVPLRHFVYPGNVHWNEEGHRFAWHMKLRDKQATGTLFVVVKETGERIKIRLAHYLTRRQAAKMRTRPDMLLQFAHFLAEEYADHGDVAVHAHVFVSLNGRRIARFVDPEVDLAREPRTLGHAPWILPGPGTAR